MSDFLNYREGSGGGGNSQAEIKAGCIAALEENIDTGASGATSPNLLSYQLCKEGKIGTQYKIRPLDTNSHLKQVYATGASHTHQDNTNQQTVYESGFDLDMLSIELSQITQNSTVRFYSLMNDRWALIREESFNPAGAIKGYKEVYNGSRGRVTLQSGTAEGDTRSVRAHYVRFRL